MSKLPIYTEILSKGSSSKDAIFLDVGCNSAWNQSLQVIPICLECSFRFSGDGPSKNCRRRISRDERVRLWLAPRIYWPRIQAIRGQRVMRDHFFRRRHVILTRLLGIRKRCRRNRRASPWHTPQSRGARIVSLWWIVVPPLRRAYPDAGRSCLRKTHLSLKYFEFSEFNISAKTKRYYVGWYSCAWCSPPADDDLT